MQFWSKTKGFLAIAGVASLSTFCISSASAAPISGSVTFTGFASVSGTMIDFQPQGGGQGTINNAVGTGSFSGVSVTPAGTIKDLDISVETPGPAGFPALANFITFNGASNAELDLTTIDLGSDGLAGCVPPPGLTGQTCTPPNSPFNLENRGGAFPGDLAKSSTISLTLHGNTLNTTTMEKGTFDGTFTAQFDRPYQVVLAQLQGGAFSEVLGFSAVINTAGSTSPVPEPASMILLGSGLIGIYVIGRKRLTR